MQTLVLTGLVLSRGEKLSSGYRLTDDEKLLLDTVFIYDPHPNQTKIKDLAHQLVVNENKVYNWFSRERFKLKRDRAQARLLQSKYMYILCFEHVHNFYYKRTWNFLSIHVVFMHAI